MDIPTGIAEVMVPDTWAALFALATYVLERVKPLVVAVTGSNGKTSTKEMVAAILAKNFKVHRTQGNLNTETGLPLTLLSLEPDHTALVLEMGMQQPGDIGRLAALAKPRSSREQRESWSPRCRGTGSRCSTRTTNSFLCSRA
jgi:UDP-N-acetylmuramoyl-tripeptide--D-alanyl-D-alanine ligase